MRLGFLSSMAALLAGTGLVLGQQPEYYYVQNGSLPARSLPATTVLTQAAPEGGAATVQTNSSGYDCLGCGAGGCGTGGCGFGGCGAGFCENTTELCMPTPYSCYYRAELLLWTIQRTAVPAVSGLPLIGTINATFTQPAGAGFVPPGPTPVAVPINATVFSTTPGSDSRLGGEHLGSRMTLGMWFDSESHCGLEVSAFILERRASSITTAIGPQLVDPEEGQIFIAVPATPPAPAIAPAPNFSQVSTVNFFLSTGSSSVVSSVANQLWGVEANGRCGRYAIGCFSLGSLAGFRYLNFEEDALSATSATLTFLPGTTIGENVTVEGGIGGIGIIQFQATSLPAVPDSPLTMTSLTSVRTVNQWYGYQLGGDFEWACGPCFLNGFAKFGLGGMHQAADVLVIIPGADPLALAATNGHHTRNRVAGIMEGNINVGWAFTPGIRAYLGYNYLYIMRVARPNGLVVNGSNDLDVTIPGEEGTIAVTISNQTPVFRFADRDMWVQGVQFGLEFRY